MAKMPPSINQLVPVELIERKIYLIRGHRVMLDSNLAELYQVETRVLVQAVKRNIGRFPEDFMFQLSTEEAESLRSQSVISNVGRGGRRYLPYAFTEHGVSMLSSVLKSERAVQLNILIIRAFIHIREYLATHKDVILEIEDLKRTQQEQGQQITAIVDVINRLLAPPPEPPKGRIGFHPRDEKPGEEGQQ